MCNIYIILFIIKQASIDAHNMWETCGKPNSGLVYDLRRDSKYKYKLAIRQAAELKDMDLDDEISQLYIAKDMNKFWKKWNSKFSKRNEIPHNINGRETDQDIADVFSNNFAQVCFNSYKDSDRVAKLWDSLHSKFLSEYDAIEGQLNTFHIDDIEASLKSLKNGKAGGLDGLTKEHIIHCHPAVIVHLKLLFNMMYIHGFVPDNFGVGVTVPIVKDKCGNITSADNYRPITISPVFSKLFEYCILHKFGEQLTSSDLQFGFKKHLSCAHAIFTLRQVTDFFVSHGSNMYMAALDAKKAFDRVNHIKLFELLIGKGLPARLVKLVVVWYGKTFSVTKWNNSLSDPISIKSGIRQGGILSPILFNMYIDVIINALEISDNGCHIGKTYVGCVVYADDIILLSASVSRLQDMINTCVKKGAELDIIFNANKSKLFSVGPSCNNQYCNLVLGSDSIEWVKELKYLGLYFISCKKFKIDVSVAIKRFYASANAIGYDVIQNMSPSM